jgi:hypothetical protein
MIPPILLWLASQLLAAWSAITRPREATCAPGWILTLGVRPTGEYVCERFVDDGERPPMDAPDGPRVEGRIWCGEGERAVQIGNGARAVGCRRVRASP